MIFFLNEETACEINFEKIINCFQKWKKNVSVCLINLFFFYLPLGRYRNALVPKNMK